MIVVLSFGVYERIKAKKNAEIQSKIIEEQEKGIQAVFQAQEEERKRISKDLHDGIGQQLSGIKMAFHRIANGLKEKNPKQQEEIEMLSNYSTVDALVVSRCMPNLKITTRWAPKQIIT